MNSYQKCCNNLIIEKNLPKIQNYLNKNRSNVLKNENTHQLNESFSCSNPNISGSPPNNFMSLLEKRMKCYHSR